MTLPFETATVLGAARAAGYVVDETPDFIFVVVPPVAPEGMLVALLAAGFERGPDGRWAYPKTYAVGTLVVLSEHGGIRPARTGESPLGRVTSSAGYDIVVAIGPGRLLFKGAPAA